MRFFSFQQTHPKKSGILPWVGLEPMSPYFLVRLLTTNHGGVQLPSVMNLLSMYLCIYVLNYLNKYRKSHELECILWFMGASDVLKFSRLHKPKVSAIWKLQNITSDNKSRNSQLIFLVFRIFFLLLNITLVWSSKMTVSHFVFVFNFGTCGCFSSNFILYSKS